MTKGWEVKTLGDVCEKASSNISQNQLDKEDGIYPIYGASGLIKKVSFYHQENQYIGIVKDGAGIGRIMLLDAKSSVIGTLQYLLPKENIDTRFFYYFLSCMNWNKYRNGSTIPHIYFKDYCIEPFPIPPLSDQQRIVSLLDETFEGIEKAKGNVQRNLQNAKDLFQSELNNIFTKKGEGWGEKRLGEVCEYEKTPNKRNDLPYVGLENIESNTGKFTGSFKPQQVKSNTFYFNDKHVLYGRLRPYLNKVLLPNFEGHCSTEIFPIKVNNELERSFLFYWLISSNTVEKIDATWTGARMPRANMNVVVEFKFSFPSIEIQNKIVKQLDKLSTETKRLEEKYQEKLNSLEELKKSILQQAFKGEL